MNFTRGDDGGEGEGEDDGEGEGPPPPPPPGEGEGEGEGEGDDGEFDADGNTTGFGIPEGLVGNVFAGEDIWIANCAFCHPTSDDHVDAGPFGEIVEELAEVPEMSGLNLLDQEIADLTAYLNFTRGDGDHHGDDGGEGEGEDDGGEGEGEVPPSPPGEGEGEGEGEGPPPPPPGEGEGEGDDGGEGESVS